MIPKASFGALKNIRNVAEIERRQEHSLGGCNFSVTTDYFRSGTDDAEFSCFLFTRRSAPELSHFGGVYPFMRRRSGTSAE